MKTLLLVFRNSSLCQMGALCFYLLAHLEPRCTISALQLVSLRGGRAAAAQFRVTHGAKASLALWPPCALSWQKVHVGLKAPPGGSTASVCSDSFSAGGANQSRKTQFSMIPVAAFRLKLPDVGGLLSFPSVC